MRNVYDNDGNLVAVVQKGSTFSDLAWRARILEHIKNTERTNLIRAWIRCAKLYLHPERYYVWDSGIITDRNGIVA